MIVHEHRVCAYDGKRAISCATQAFTEAFVEEHDGPFHLIGSHACGNVDREFVFMYRCPTTRNGMDDLHEHAEGQTRC